jgi:hypothetical protein
MVTKFKMIEIRYPPQSILSVVSRIPTTEFNGPEQTNGIFRKLGFEIV